MADMARIWQAIWEHTFRYFFAEGAVYHGGLDQIRASLEPFIPAYVVAVAEGRVVGIGARTGSYIDDLWIDPPFQGCGIGAQLLDHLTSAVRKDGYSRATLHVMARNHGARRFYEREGWRFVKHEKRPTPQGEALFCNYERDL
jgi:ribosomal protein S18 acetylase RimI-like enzyme